MDIIDEYVTTYPCPQNAIDIVRGEWISRFPPTCGQLEAGGMPLFQDSRINWAAEKLGGFEGLSVLELGPLEGGHSYMLEQKGAAKVVAIEANRRAFVKCLIAKEVLQLKKVQFRLGDFVEFLRQPDECFDVCIASGVLYHMQNPVELLSLIAARVNRLMLWTHYYDEEIIKAHPNLQKEHFTGQKQAVFDGFDHSLHRLNYLDSLKSPKFAGAGSVFSHWMTRSDILAALEHFGFDHLEIAFENKGHQHGPCFAIAASKLS